MFCVPKVDIMQRGEKMKGNAHVCSVVFFPSCNNVARKCVCLRRTVFQRHQFI
uniref:Uncharacterized protein n=1 Tax=Anguilla anguilla TaxID=7936 RepID=A0A0E9WYJ3_ANGAN